MRPKHSWKPNYLVRPIDGKVLLTANHGAWAVISQRQFANLNHGRPGQVLCRELEAKGLIRTRENSRDIEKQIQKWMSPYLRGTTLHIVVATRRCNLQCNYCHASASGLAAPQQDLDPAIGKRIADFILQSPASQITIEFQGGEPLLNFPVIKRFIEYVENESVKAAKKVAFSLVSNFTLLTQEILSYAKQHQISLCTSLDGPGDLHDLNRHFPTGKGTHELVCSSLKKAADCGQDIGILSVLSGPSMSRYRQIVDMYVQMGKDELCVNPVQKLGTARDNWDAIGIRDYEHFLSIYREILDYTFELLESGAYIMDRMFLLALSKITSNYDVSYMDFRSPCGAVIGQLVYDINGDIYPCDESRTFPELKLGSALDQSWADVLETPSAVKVIEASLHTDRLCGRCAYKPYCGLCPVMSYAESGNLKPAPPEDNRCRFSLFLFDYLFNKLISSPDSITKVMRYEQVKNAFLAAQT